MSFFAIFHYSLSVIHYSFYYGKDSDSAGDDFHPVLSRVIMPVGARVE